jgi:Domain of unknown function (DUF4129)
VLALVQQARAAPAADREPLLAQARALLRQTNAVQLPDSTLAIDDGPLADRLTVDAIDREIAELGRYIGLTNETIVRRVDTAAADATLHSLTQQQDLAQRLNLGAIVGSLAQRAAQWLYDLVGRPDPNVLLDLQAVVGLLVALAIVALLVRGTRERIRRETALGMTAGEQRADPAVHLRAADEALRGGRPRDAIHALYLYAFATLAAREVLRYDPALTDHELLRRAAQLPRADALRDLVQLHERVWFGLRDAREPDVARARALATEAIE